MGSVVLEDCSFHEKANLTEFDRDRVISIAAQDGEVCVTKRETDIEGGRERERREREREREKEREREREREERARLAHLSLVYSDEISCC